MDSPFSQWNWLESFSENAAAPNDPDPESGLPGLVLLSDRTAQVVNAYGVKPLEIGGATYASRATFVIDKEGILRYVNYDYQIRADYGPLMDALNALE